MPTGWWLAVAAVDLRCGMDRLLVAVQTLLSRDAFEGGAFVFCNRTGTRIKVLVADATGVWLCVRRTPVALFGCAAMRRYARSAQNNLHGCVQAWIGNA